MATPIQDPTVGSALQRLFKLQGRVRPMLEDFVVPVVTVGSAEGHSLPSVSATAGARHFQAGVAGEYATARFAVPAGMVAQIHKITMVSSVQTTLLLKAETPPATGSAYANTADKNYQDGRLLAQGFTPGVVITYGTRAAPLGSPLIASVTVPTTGLVWEPERMIIGSGRPDQAGYFQLQFNTLAVQMTASWEWTEYAVF